MLGPTLKSNERMLVLACHWTVAADTRLWLVETNIAYAYLVSEDPPGDGDHPHDDEHHRDDVVQEIAAELAQASSLKISE